MPRANNVTEDDCSNLFNIPGTNIPVTSFGVMMALAFVGGAWIGGKQAQRYGMTSEVQLISVALFAFSIWSFWRRGRTAPPAPLVGHNQLSGQRMSLSASATVP